MGDQQPIQRTWGPAVKWVVLGLLGATALFLFRDELRGLLRRTTEHEISGEGVRIVAAKTPLGETTVSVLTAQSPLSASLVEFQSETHVSTEYGFRISWPTERSWVPSTRMTEEEFAALGMPADQRPAFMVLKTEVVGEVVPIVWVTAEYDVYGSIRAFFQTHVNYLKQYVTNDILSWRIDEGTGGAVVVVHDDITGWTSVTRLIVANGFAYKLIANQVPPSSMARKETNFILNSFRAG